MIGGAVLGSVDLHRQRHCKLSSDDWNRGWSSHENCVGFNSTAFRSACMTLARRLKNIRTLPKLSNVFANVTSSKRSKVRAHRKLRPGRLHLQHCRRRLRPRLSQGAQAFAACVVCQHWAGSPKMPAARCIMSDGPACVCRFFLGRLIFEGQTYRSKMLKTGWLLGYAALLELVVVELVDHFHNEVVHSACTTQLYQKISKIV